jgi:ABC-type lipoprotein release transport system permease subunit
MNYLFSISLRNLLRQKRRNIFLGSAMAIGVAILIVASSFSHGVSDIMFNKIVRYVAGHVSITNSEGKKFIGIYRDRARMEKLIKENAGKEMTSFDEGAGAFVRAVGNGQSENMMMIGVDTTKGLNKEDQKDIEDSFPLVDGKWEDLRRKDVENPVILTGEKAKALNVKKNDIIRIRFQNVHGQSQSARLTVVGIMNISNIFMQGVMFVELPYAKEIIGYRPYEIASVQITVKDPRKNAPIVADRIHKALQNPGPAFLEGELRGRNGKSAATILPFMGNEDDKKKLMQTSFKIIAGKKDDVYLKEGVMISDSLAAKIGAAPDKKITLRYKPKFSEKETDFEFTVKGIFLSNSETGKDTVYMHEYLFYKQFNSELPDIVKDANRAFLPKKDAAFFDALGREYVLLDRSHSTDDFRTKSIDTAKKKIKSAVIDVNSMYELASDVLKLEGALNLITVVAVIILFVIILIGVVNTLRMTIRERTREIGTIRAIGMQKKDVRRIFILETGFLALFSSIAGTILAFLVMLLLSFKTFVVSDNPLGMLLVKQHLYFLPSAVSVVVIILFIIALAVITAYLPARRAAQLSAAEALRHYE